MAPALPVPSSFAFVAPAATARSGPVVAAAALLFTAGVLALGMMAVFPFEMDTVVRFSGGRLVATHYGFYNTVVGIGILVGNLFIGTVFDIARAAGWPELPWVGMVLIGAGCSAGLWTLSRSRRWEAEPALS